MQPDCNWFLLLGSSANEKDAVQSKGEGVDGTELVHFCIIEMASHVILFAVIVDDRRFRVVIFAVFSDSIV